MREKDLLFQVLNSNERAAEAMHWLDDAFGVHDLGDDMKNKHLNFKPYDPLSFVVTILNFLREDTAPLLAPSVERSQSIENPSPASALVKFKESAVGVLVKEREQPSAQRGLFATKPEAYDISSNMDFPPMGEVSPGKNRAGITPKRRIRPTAVSSADKPSEGDITTLGAFGSGNVGAPSFGKAGEVAAVGIGDRARGLPRSLDVAEPPQRTSFKDTGTVVSAPQVVLKARNNVLVDTELSSDLGEEHEEAEEGFGEIDGGVIALREATSGSVPEPAWLVQRNFVQGREEGDPLDNLRCQRAAIPLPVQPISDGNGAFERVGKLAAGCAHGQHNPFSAGAAASHTRSVHSESHASIDRSLHTPTKPAPAGAVLRSVANGVGGGGCAASAVTPTTDFTTATGKECGQGDERRLGALASLYVHIMSRRFVPSLATELHLTIRLLHVHSEVVRSGTHRVLKLEQDCLEDLSTRISASAGSSPTAATRLKMDDTPELKIVFRTALDCRQFAANVLLGLKSLLPHIGADTLDLLAGSLVLASQSGDLIEKVRGVLGEAKGDGVKTDGNEQNTDDTAIVQSVGAPFAALQWREEDSLNNFRTPSDRTVFQNRQESVDRFGSLLRDYQVSKRGLQQYPERALQDLRTAACALLASLAPENFSWLAQYFLGQLVGWGLAAPEETDSEVIGLVPAGDKNRLQKLHRRISTPSFGEDGNALKSSQKLRHQPRSRQGQAATGPRHRKGQTPVTVTGVRIPTAPLQLRWFPGNQDFFYHVLLVLDSHTFNSHLKAELVAEIARLYHQQTSLKTSRKGGECVSGRDDSGASSSRAIGEGGTGFTGTMVKLKVLAKFLGLLTFRPNWGVPTSDAASTTRMPPLPSANEKVHPANCPLPLNAYLDHAWSTAGLVGAVPWIADFLRMMKWDGISAQAGLYRHVLSKLATLHSQPYMRPGHPDFTECLLAVSCEVESLFQDLGSDLGVHGYRLSCLPSKAVDFAATDDDRIPAQASALSARMSSNAESGSLDHEVVLSRRLIQNCCPYLEDVLTLIKSLGRGWEQGFVAGGNGTPFRAGHSPRVIGASGTSPRSRRVIKPHPMKPMRVLPSLAEQHQRGESSGETLRTGRGGVQSESARLRLVEAFFHSLPDELQVTADFAVKRAVQNACEEVLAAVIRPAAAAIISRLDMPFGHEHTGKVRGTGGEGFVRHRVDHVMAVLGKSLMSKASSLAGERGHAVATAATLSLAPHSLSLRVRQMAATIAGNHAQLAAERKLREMTMKTVSEAMSAHHVEQFKEQAANPATAANEQFEAMGVKPLSGRSQNVRGELFPKGSASNLCAIASTVVDSAHTLVVGFRKEVLLEAVHQVSTSGANDLQAIETVVAETAHLVEEIRRGRNYRVMVQGVHGTSNTEGTRRGVGHGSGEQEETPPSGSIMVGSFLSSLSLFYAALPDCNHGVWKSLRNSSTSTRTLGNTLEDLIHLAVIAWERDDLLPNSGFGLEDAIDVDLGRKYGGDSHSTDLPQDSCSCVPPWAPVIQVLSWGVIPILTAENSLLSCIQAAANLEPGAEALGSRDGANSWKRDGLLAVVAAVAKEYHSLGVGQDLSAVSLVDLWGFAPRASNAAQLGRYHPMDLYRLIGRLAMA